MIFALFSNCLVIQKFLFIYFPYFPVKEIVDEIENCKTMTALRMEGNTLGVEAAEEMAKALAKHPEFQVGICVLFRQIQKYEMK